ncbi:hypothetical protein M0802_012469 [Mischocyttarus mexicanus]|nr:hypothetical protein M0802_012478 [Mischocyttarus mexicanus]KAI4486214.1 hypothetical protein M0802_012469 [Mischocyttarus mexicanus]
MFLTANQSVGDNRAFSDPATTSVKIATNPVRGTIQRALLLPPPSELPHHYHQQVQEEEEKRLSENDWDLHETLVMCLPVKNLSVTTSDDYENFYSQGAYKDQSHRFEVVLESLPKAKIVVGRNKEEGEGRKKEKKKKPMNEP